MKKIIDRKTKEDRPKLKLIDVQVTKFKSGTSYKLIYG